jgi:hypothetical protein
MSTAQTKSCLNAYSTKNNGFFLYYLSKDSAGWREIIRLYYYMRLAIAFGIFHSDFMQIRVGLGFELGKKGGEYVSENNVWGPIF